MNETEIEEFNTCVDDLQLYSQLLMSINPEQKIDTDVIQKVGNKLNEICRKLVELSCSISS